jgi:hypothetical protein
MRCGRCRFCARSVERVAQALADPNHFGLNAQLQIPSSSASWSLARRAGFVEVRMKG